MMRGFGRALGTGAVGVLVMGYGAVSCLGEDSAEVTTRISAGLDSAQPEAGMVAPPIGLRRVEAPSCVVGDCETEFPQPFMVHEIGQSDTHIYVAFKRPGGTAGTGSTVAAAEIDATVMTADCQVGRVSARGAVRQAAQPSWVEIPVSELPDGEFTLMLSGRVGSVGLSASIPLRKTASGVGYLPMSQRKGYREVEIRHPTTGEILRAATLDAECEP